MKVLVSWLKDYVDINVSVDELCERLTRTGFEVEEVIDLSKRFTGVVAGKILETDKHPDADKLRVCKVDAGGAVLQIVTNSAAVNAGDVVPLALAGATLANGNSISEGRVRGVLSQGMFCGMEELGIEKTFYPSNEDGIMILKGGEAPGDSLTEILGLNDYILDVNITANRPDCNSVYGVAREVAAALGQKCRNLKLDFAAESEKQTADLVSVSIEDTELCPLYAVQGVTDVRIKPSPTWLAKRLCLCGIRSINNIVDITNYVLLELGQPMHAFSCADISGGKITVRRARGEKLKLLDESEHTLGGEVLVIADERGCIGIAGVMGGSGSGIKPDTTAVVFESARFLKESIRRTSRSCGVRTEASARFEKGVDSFTPELALSRAMHLISETDCARICGGRIVCSTTVAGKRKVSFPYSSIKRLIGVDVPEDKTLSILKNLEIDCEIINGVISCTPPAYREDIVRDCDIIEEIIRFYGYHNIVPTLLEGTACTMGGYTKEQKEIAELRDYLRANGFHEIITYSFLGEADYGNSGVDSHNSIRLSNPLGEEMSLMRNSLIPSMLKTVGLNHNKKNGGISLFEIGKSYIANSLPLTDFPKESIMLCLAESGEDKDYYGLKAQIINVLKKLGLSPRISPCNIPYLHPGASAEISVGCPIGKVGQIHPQIGEYYSKDNIFICEINLSEALRLAQTAIKYKSIGKYPATTRDIAVTVDDNALAGDILDMISKTEYCENVELFDLYKGEQTGFGKKSLAFSITFRTPERTLTDNEIDEIMKRLTEKLESAGAALRS